jgi:hypothetical protein
MRAHLVVLGLVLATACGSETGMGPTQKVTVLEEPWSGTYSLKFINGERLPHTWSYPASSSATIVGRTIYVYSGHTWSSLTRYSDQPGAATGDTVITQTGTWTRSDPEGFVTLTTVDGATDYGGIASGDLLRLAESGDVFDYAR